MNNKDQQLISEAYDKVRNKTYTVYVKWISGPRKGITTIHNKGFTKDKAMALAHELNTKAEYRYEVS